MVASELSGRVLVVAGDDRLLLSVAGAAAASGALVALVAPSRPALDVALCFRADPADADAWSRIAPHVEQRLGPVDAVVTDARSATACEDVFGADLRRRGHGAVVVVATGDDEAAVLRRLAGTR